MKKIIILLIAFIFVVSARAQVIINPQLPALGLVLKSQLWNLSLINAGSSAINIQIQMMVTDESNNINIFSGTTNTITLRKGSTLENANSISPVSYNILATGYGVDTSPDGFLPFGIFNICYTINAVGAEGSNTLTEECESVEISPLSPPLLITPEDSDVVDITRPLFTWLPPGPSNQFNNLTYNFTLVEIEPTQSSSDAIQQNLPLLSQGNVTLLNMQYPLSLPELDTGKYYAWQVQATNNGIPVSNSEIWTFSIKHLNSDTTKAVVNDYYAKLKSTIDGSFTLMNGLLKFGYRNKLNAPTANINIYDVTMSARTQVQLDSSYVNIVFGQNYLTLDLSQNNILTNNHIYLLDFIDANNEHWYLRFQYIKPNN